MLELIAQRTCLVAGLALVVAFLDAPLQTLGQRYGRNRWAERLVLLSIEMNLVLLWALFVPYARRDLALAPAGWSAPVAVAGAVLALAGAALAIAAKLRLGRWFTVSFAIKHGHELVTDGPYAIVRHPIYTGALAWLLGCAFAWRSLGTLILAVALAVPFLFHTWIEEPMLESHFGEAWRAYRQRVPRLVPGWRFSSTPAQRR